MSGSIFNSIRLCLRIAVSFWDLKKEEKTLSKYFFKNPQRRYDELLGTQSDNSRPPSHFPLFSVVDLDFGKLNPDPDPGRQNLLTKIEKSDEVHVFICWMFSSEG
jgi:hypothetical protein